MCMSRMLDASQYWALFSSQLVYIYTHIMVIASNHVSYLYMYNSLLTHTVHLVILGLHNTHVFLIQLGGVQC